MLLASETLSSKGGEEVKKKEHCLWNLKITEL